MSDDTGFLSRWSRRKAEVRVGHAVPSEPPLPVAPVVAVTAPVVAGATPPVESATVAPPPAAAAAAPPAPTLADVAQLTRDSDYTRFVAPDVDPGVKNAALKKLFGDPHFNVMDGLDTYIDDYGKPDPLPTGVLRKMAQARLLGLFSDDDTPSPDAAPIATATPTPPDTAAHEDTDLRLQPHDAAGRTGPEPGAGEDTGREH